MAGESQKLTVLWDIDGTLMLTGGAGITAMKQTLHRLLGVTDYPELEYHGRTDYAIVRDLFSKLDLPFEKHFRAFRQLYHVQLASCLKESKGGLLPGVPDLLRVMLEDQRCSLGLLTGNAREAAQLKLAAYGVEHFFEFGGYGDHHLERDDVAREAKAAAAEKLGLEFHPERVVVIGDTPADVKCGRAIGARVVAVATGGCSLERLAESKPDFLVSNLAELSLDQLF